MYGFKIGPGLETLQAGVKYVIVEENKINQLQDEIETLKQSCRSHGVIAKQRLDKIKNLNAVIEHQKEVIERQGKEALRRHDFLCEIKEILDNYFGE